MLFTMTALSGAGARRLPWGLQSMAKLSLKPVAAINPPLSWQLLASHVPRAFVARSFSSTRRVTFPAVTTRKGTGKTTTKATKTKAKSKAAPKKTAKAKTASARSAKTARKTPARKTLTRKTPASKTKTKVKAKVKAKPKPKAKTKAKAKVAPKKRKVLTPEEKARAEKRELRKVAMLDEPRNLPDRSWLVYTVQQIQKSDGTTNIASMMKGLAASYKALGTDELERLKTIADQNRLTNKAAYRAWVESKPVKSVIDANKARGRLLRKFGLKKPKIDDTRLPARPPQPYVYFAKSRWSSGEFQGVPFKNITQSIAQEWKDMPSSQKQPFIDIQEADKAKYESRVHDINA